MSYKAGETSWYEKFTPEQRQEAHRKPWVPGSVGSLLADAGAIASLLPPPPIDVLDAGCAEGYLAHILSLCGYRVTAADVCEPVLAAARGMTVRWNELNSTPTFVSMDFDRLPENRWDAIIFASALHHSMDRRATLASCFKALRPGGMLLASEPGVGHGEGKHAKEWAAKMDVTEKSTPPYGIAKDAKKVGFVKVRVYPNPITLHKAAYEVSGLAHHPLVKAIAALPIGVAAVGCAKWFHGLTVMRKPENHHSTADPKR
jgi:SAM-dependent methyltransferase